MDEDQNFTEEIKRKIFRFIFTIVAMFVLSFAVLFLWNAVLPQVIHAGPINYWQALALLAICRLLFGNFNFGLPWGRGGRFDGHKPANKFMNMNEQDETAFKEEWKTRREKWGR
jgi:hypothetical protein